MIALYRYTVVGLLLSQRYLPPTLLFLAALSVGTASDSGPLVRTYSFCVAAMFVCGSWLTVAVVNHEDRIQRSVTIVSAGSTRRALAATVAVAATGCAVLTAIGLALPNLVGSHVITLDALAIGAAAQLAAGLVGVALGLLCSRLVVRKVGHALLAALAGILAVLLAPWTSPVMPLVRLLSSKRPPGELIGPVAVLGLLAAAMLCVSVAITHTIATRRE
jgi:hypothetical protein